MTFDVREIENKVSATIDVTIKYSNPILIVAYHSVTNLHNTLEVGLHELNNLIALNLIRNIFHLLRWR